MTNKKAESQLFWDKLGLTPATLTEARKIVEAGLRTGDCTCVIGEAGIGKTDMMKQIAKDKDMKTLFYYFAHIEREDIAGIPFPVENGKSYKFLIEDAVAKMIESGEETLLVLDECNRGEKPVMSAAFTMIESRRFGSVHLPDSVHIVACMNPSEGDYLVNEFEQDPAFRRRMCFCAVHATIDTWKAYAAGRGKFHRNVVEFVSKNPKLLNDVNSRAAGMIYANPASWEKISDQVKDFEKDAVNFVENEDMLNIFRLKSAGHIGITATDKFIQFLQESATSVDPYDVIFRYKSQARKSILKLVSTGRTDVLSELADNVALLLLSEEPPVDKISRHVAALCVDLPEDPLVMFLGKLRKYAREQNKIGPDGFYAALNKSLNEIPEFKEAIGKLDTAVFNVGERVNGDSDSE